MEKAVETLLDLIMRRMEQCVEKTHPRHGQWEQLWKAGWGEVSREEMCLLDFTPGSDHPELRQTSLPKRATNPTIVE